MKISGVEKLSLVDYPGRMCATLFTSGCNLRCPYCHNSGLVFNKYDAIDNEEIFEFLEMRKGMLDAVCISGGEPTLQKDLVDFITRLKVMGYKVKLDTNGTNPLIVTYLIGFKMIDYIAMDIKNCWDKYPETTDSNVCVPDVQQSFLAIIGNDVNYEFRTTLISEFHDEESIRKMGQDLKGAQALVLQKFVDNGTCIKSGYHAVPYETAEKYRRILRETIPLVVLRGYN